MSTNLVQHTTIRFERLMDVVRKAIKAVGNDYEPDVLSKLEVLTEHFQRNRGRWLYAYAKVAF